MNKFILTLLISLVVHFSYAQTELQNDFDVAVAFLKSRNYQKAADAFKGVKGAVEAPRIPDPAVGEVHEGGFDLLDQHGQLALEVFEAV